jgi:hypothetical protein
MNEEKVINSTIKITQIKYGKICIDLDLTEFEVIEIKRNDKTLIFPIWEFWQILEKNSGWARE